MNSINIIQRDTKPHPKYNSVVTFSEALKADYGHIRQWLGVELSEGEESFDGRHYTWKMNLSARKIKILIKAIKLATTKITEAHGYRDEVAPNGG